MTPFSMRPLGVALLSLSLAAGAAPVSAGASPATPVLGIALGGAPGAAPAPGASRAMSGRMDMHQPRSGMVMAHAGHNDAQGNGTVNSVDAAQHKINISHGPIPAIGFPAMTMDFAVAPAVDLRAVKPGMRVDFTVEQGAGGMYEIQSVTPSGGGR